MSVFSFTPRRAPLYLITFLIFFSFVLHSYSINKISQSSPLLQAKLKLLGQPLEAQLDLYTQAILSGDQEAIDSLEREITLLLPRADSTKLFRFATLEEQKNNFDQEKLTQTLILLKENIAQNPTASLWIEKARTLWLLGEREDALLSLQEARKLDPLNKTVETTLLKQDLW